MFYITGSSPADALVRRMSHTMNVNLVWLLLLHNEIGYRDISHTLLVNDFGRQYMSGLAHHMVENLNNREP
jgi:hypothetical protein